MASVLDDIINSHNTQHTAPNNTSLVLSTRQNSPGIRSNNSPSDSEDEDTGNNPVVQPPRSTVASPDNVTAFAINTARDLRLSADGEKALLQFSRVFFSSSHLFMMLTSRFELDTKSALIYQQASLIKLNEIYLRYGSSAMGQASQAGSEELVLTKAIMVFHHSFS